MEPAGYRHHDSAAAAQAGDRWTFLVLRECFFVVRRFVDFRRNLGVGDIAYHQTHGGDPINGPAPSNVEPAAPPDVIDSHPKGHPIMNTRPQRIVTVERTIAAEPAAIFQILTDPDRHAAVDGSRTLLPADPDAGAITESLRLGSVFITPMTRVPRSPHAADLVQAVIAVARGGRMRNTVVEYELDRRIAWCNFGRHIWRYELEPTTTPTGPATLVRESFDYATNLTPWLLEYAGFPTRNAQAMTESLDNLNTLMTGEPLRRA